MKFYNITNGSKLNLVVKHSAASTGGTASSTSSTGSAATVTSSTTAAVTSSTTAASSTTAKDDVTLEKGRFQILLQQFLQQHYTPEDMAKLMEQVNKVSVE